MTETSSDTITPNSMPALQVSESAANRISVLLKTEAQPGSMLRLSVLGGGCSGFQYSFSFDDTQTEEDRIFEKNGIKVVVDDMSLEMLNGAELDYVEDLIGASFQIRNPNAASSCGCGNSFAV